jgi:NitT/TauT family transport system permease protein
MIFGAVGSKGGLGWYIFKQRVFMDTAGMFAGLMIIVVIGIIVEDFIFTLVEARTIKKWGLG